MSKLLIIIGLIAAFLIIKHLISSTPRSKTLNGAQKNSVDSESSGQPLEFKETVKCRYCGTHIPLATAYKNGDSYFCNESHFEKAKTEI